MPQVHRAARHVEKNGIPPWIEMDDLVAEGMIGAIRAVDSYDDSRGVPLYAYAHRRIVGQMYDMIRDRGPITRNHYAKIKAGEAPMVGQVSLDAPVMYGDQSGESTTLADLLPDDENAIARMIDVLAVRTIIDKVAQPWQDVLFEYYFEGSTLLEMGVKRGITESRVSQLLSAARAKAYEFVGDVG